MEKPPCDCTAALAVGLSRECIPVHSFLLRSPYHGWLCKWVHRLIGRFIVNHAMPHNAAEHRCYDLGSMQNPFSSWSTLQLERGLGLRYQVIADIEELLREPLAEFDDEYVNNLQETRDRASLTAKQIDEVLQNRTK